MSFIRIFSLIRVTTSFNACVTSRHDRAASQETKNLHQIFDDEWERRLRENPSYASTQGIREYNDRWPDLRPEAIQASRQADKEVLARLKTIKRLALPEAERLNYDLFRYNYENRIRGHAFNDHLIVLNQRGGIQTRDELAGRIPVRDEKDYLDWIRRLETFGSHMDETVALLAEGVKTGWTLPRIIAERIPPQIEAQLVARPEDSGFYRPFIDMPDRIDAATKEELRQKGKAAIEGVVLPAYKRLLEFYTATYLPGAKETIGARHFPDGHNFYTWQARHYTTTDLTPEEIHEIGLKEVARIRQDMDRVIKQVEFGGSFAEFLHFLRTDPQFYFDNPAELLTAYRATAKEIDPLLPEFFGRMPRMPYGIRPIPEAIAPDTTTAYYMSPSADGRRAGYFYVNLYKPETRPKYEIEALTVHEAVPGHHFQIALAMEIEGLPKFRRFGGYTAYIEGWALYTEWLGEEMGLYKDPYSKFGQLTYEMWRAVRLVIDTGIHHMDWSRAQAIDYFMKNAARPEHDIINEVDRYIAWPGQALAYKIGELRIRELRSKAETALGDRFDIRAFHDAVLEQGAVPLDILEAIVADWIQRVQSGETETKS